MKNGNNSEFEEWLKMIEEQEKERLAKYQEMVTLFEEGER